MSKQKANKSKVVFAVVSQGNGLYAAMTRVAVASLRLSNPGLRLVVACDRETDVSIRRAGNPLINEVDEWVVVDTQPGNAGFRSRFIKTSLRALIEGTFLFLDSDVFVRGDLNEIFTLNADVAGARNHSRVAFNEQVWVQDITILAEMGWNTGNEVYINTGVLYYNDTPGTHQFAAEWCRRWIRSFARLGDHCDQPAMNSALHVTQPRLTVLPDHFNAQFKNTPNVAYDAVIWHYFAAHNKPPHTPFEILANDLMLGSTLDKGKIAAIADGKHPWRRNTVIDDWAAAAIIRRGCFNGWESAWLRREMIRCIFRYVPIRSGLIKRNNFWKFDAKASLKNLLPKGIHSFCRKIFYGKFYALRQETDGLLSPAHYQRIYDEVRKQPDLDVVEIGAAAGTASVAIGWAMKRDKKKSKLIIIEKCEGGTRAQYGGKAENLSRLKKNLARYGIADYCEIFPEYLTFENGSQAVGKIQTPQIAALMMDADGWIHRDFYFFWPHLQPGGLIIVDDYKEELDAKHDLTFHLLNQLTEWGLFEKTGAIGNMIFGRKPATGDIRKLNIARCEEIVRHISRKFSVSFVKRGIIKKPRFLKCEHSNP